ncbi:MAG: hypothetical protein RBT11_18355 [Desulfobacterales bacterium]|jgi:hypothetical protein|nr:hypothetical protein [Desulfobacterales bacterium]
MKKEVITVNAHIDITPAALQAIVANAKAVAGTDAKGVYRVDTADKVGEIISLFLAKMDFDTFAKDIENYR